MTPNQTLGGGAAVTPGIPSAEGVVIASSAPVLIAKMDLTAQIEIAVEACYGHYRAEAAKRGRNPAFPYVPIIRFDSEGRAQTTQIRGRAYATRDEAVRFAERQIERFKQHMRGQLRKPGCRALREQWGLPRELAREQSR